MRIEQRENNVYTKSLDKVESHLVKTVNRFFETSKDSIDYNIEHIIQEAVDRAKQEILIDINPLNNVTSVNGEKGDVLITADSINAENKFEKNSAFNKNFGNTTNTVCEGDDPRLYDERTPISHNHSEYIKREDVDKYIALYLESKGISFKVGKVIIKDNNLEITNGELVEL